MSETRWTNEQLDAITEKGCNILVAAAAGAGKTAVLVERIIQKITNIEKPIDIDRLLIVTFTNAAASEMRERIGDAITRALDANPKSRQLQRQLTLLNRASITTIHSFCLEVIRNNFHLVDLDPDFRIADQTEATLMKLEALEELFEDMYTEENIDENFRQLVECYGGGRGDLALMDMVLYIYEFVQSHPWPQKWLDKSVADFHIPSASHFGTTQWARVIIDDIRLELSGLFKLLKKARKIAEESQGLMPYMTALDSDMAMVKAIEAECSEECPERIWNGLYKAFLGLEFQRLPRCGKDADKQRQEQVKAIREEVKKSIKKMQRDIFSMDPEEMVRELKSLHPLMKCLAELVMKFGSQYAAKKKEKSLLDFNDLEHYCLEILTQTNENGDVIPSRAAALLRERFEEILVDEYQDSNLVQEVIINSISKKEPEAPNIFMVGDVKQSIYRFRQARPELFLEKYDEYSGEKGANSRKILLYKNFRSRGEIINGVNFIFKQIMSRKAGELDYDDNEALKPGAIYKSLGDEGGQAGGAIEFHLLNGADDSSDYESELEADAKISDAGESGEILDSFGSETEKPDDVQAEARVVISRIKELMEHSGEEGAFKVFDKNTKSYRNIQYKDIVILLRTTQNWAEVFVEELTGCGIPVYADTAAGFFKTVEVQVMLSLLQVIDNPLQDIPLLSVLRSPIADFTAEDLIDIRLADRNIPFFEAMMKLASEGEGDAAEKVRAFLDSLQKWRNKALYMSTDELIWFLYSETGYYSYAGAMPGGIQRQANLRAFFEKARQYENTSYRGLFNFINFINRLKSSRGDVGSAKIVGENENVVRIMSIHKSKGLEFPIVFVSGCGKKFNMQDMNARILLHQDLGFGPDFVDYERRIVHSTVAKQALKSRLRQETISEELRILYVAFTRAREKLIITGLAKDAQKATVKWCSCADSVGVRLPEYEVLKGISYLDWIGAALARHKDCEGIRELAGIGKGELELINDSSSWNVKFWDKNDVVVKTDETQRNDESIIEQIKGLDTRNFDSEYGEEVMARLGWQYQYNYLSQIPTKVSVTELKRRFGVEMSEELSPLTVFAPALVKKPLFLDGDVQMSSAEKGTLLHFVMQHLELNRIYDAMNSSASPGYKGWNDALKDEIAVQLGKMLEEEFLTKQQAAAVDTGRIARFFHSPIGLRMLKVQKVNREIPFYLELNCDEVFKYFGGEHLESAGFTLDPGALADCAEGGIMADGETVLLQGVIDCYFEEGDKVILLDYKTDYVPFGGEGIIKDRYRIQIEYYAAALERILGRKVEEKYVYLFWNGQLMRFP